MMRDPHENKTGYLCYTSQGTLGRKVKKDRKMSIRYARRVGAMPSPNTIFVKYRLYDAQYGGTFEPDKVRQHRLLMDSIREES